VATRGSGGLRPRHSLERSAESERRLVGVVFKVQLEEKVANFLDKKEFRTNGCGHLVKISSVDVAQVAAGTVTPQGCTLEACSHAFLTNNWLA
jgi:hypothetical protein